MKKFSFSLDTVLNYKNQVLDSLMNEHATVLAEIRRQEDKIEDLGNQYVECGQKLKEEQLRGVTVMQICTYENYLDVLLWQIDQEKEKLALLKRKEEIKRQQVVEARQESSSIEKLKERKRERYDKEVQKEEELLIEEFVSNKRSKQLAV